MRIAALLAIAITLTVTPSVALQLRNNRDWYKLDENEFECLNQALIHHYGTSIALLDSLGYGPDDKRIALLRMKCQEMLLKRRSPSSGVPWPP
jgi:hypothetical protein